MPFGNLAPKLTAEEYEKNFAEISPQMTRSQAVSEAARCLYCFDAPCTKACPTHIDVPAFIKKIATGNLRGSARVILEANPFGHSCARACPVGEAALALDAAGRPVLRPEGCVGCGVCVTSCVTIPSSLRLSVLVR